MNRSILQCAVLLLAIAGLAACQTTGGPGATRAQPEAAAPDSAPDTTPRTPEPPAIVLPTFIQDEPDPLVRGEQVFKRLVRRFADVPCVRDPLVERWQGRYAGSPTRFAADLARILPLMALALEDVERYRMPGEFVLLPIVESWYRPDAGARSAHVGLWQFGAPTARGMGLTVTRDYDARMAPLLATDAAIRHLADLHNRFGDWKLANMGFNAGPYRMQKILERHAASPVSASDRQPPGLSPVTYEHLAKVQALACLIAKPERFDIELPNDAVIVPLVPVTLPPGASTLAAIATASGVDAATLKQLNPSFRDGIVSAAAGRDLLVPAPQAAKFSQFTLPAVASPNRDAVAQAGAGGSHVIRSGDTLGAIARHYRLRLRDLLDWNGLSPRSILRPGQRIKLEP